MTTCSLTRCRTYNHDMIFYMKRRPFTLRCECSLICYMFSIRPAFTFDLTLLRCGVCDCSAFFTPRSFLQSVPLGVPRLLVLFQDTQQTSKCFAVVCMGLAFPESFANGLCYTGALPALRIHCLATAPLKGYSAIDNCDFLHQIKV